MIKKVISIIIIVIISAAEINSQVTDKSFIVIDASSSVQVPAKEITISFEIAGEDTNALKAYQDLKSVEKQTLKLFEKFKIADSNIVYSLARFYREGGFNKQPLKYRASENVIVKLFDFKQYEPFQIELLTNGIYAFNGYFSTPDVKEAREEGLNKALENAKEEAEAIAKKLGRELGKVLEVDSKSRSNVISPGLQTMMVAADERKLLDIPQKITFSTNITVKYELK